MHLILSYYLRPEGGIYEDLEEDIKLPPNKTALEVASDFFTEICNGSSLEKYTSKAKYCSTAPTVWSNAAKSATRQAAVNAGCVDNTGLLLTAKPEAADIFCAKIGVYNFETETIFLIVDCNGDTVDLIAYEVADSTSSSVSVQEFVTGVGAASGSA
ncbi:hypothetical protein V1512DRAFT_255575 [Lipomyces arxii]|uniref:uncharacterized protein n=1 Tax=Lipomyces arxii TaxID=56418 RepID=UPI0034CF6F51